MNDILSVTRIEKVLVDFIFCTQLASWESSSVTYSIGQWCKNWWNQLYDSLHEKSIRLILTRGAQKWKELLP